MQKCKKLKNSDSKQVSTLKNDEEGCFGKNKGDFLIKSVSIRVKYVY